MMAASTKSVGPRERSRRAVLDAAWSLFAERGLRELTVEAIAERAGVAKTTVYRWWPSKTAVLMDALLTHLDPAIEFPDTGSAREDLRQQISSVIELFTTTDAGRAYLALVVECEHDPLLATAFTDRYIAHRREGAHAMLLRGVRRGELRSDLDADIVIDALWGAVYYRLLVSRQPTAPGYVDQLLDQLYPGIASAPTSTERVTTSP